MSVKLEGNSGCKLELSIYQNTPVVVKSQGNFLNLDYEVLQNLKKHNIYVPEYYSVEPHRVIMRYLDGVNIVDYINQSYDLDKLAEFCQSNLSLFLENSILQDRSKELHEKFLNIEPLIPTKQLNFRLYELYDSLPKEIPCGIYHGDFTLENIIYWNDNFYLIDANYTMLDSAVFDCAKIRQDSTCGWFVRRNTMSEQFYDRLRYLDLKIKNLNNFSSDNHILIFMLLRVYPYCHATLDQNWLIDKINLLWDAKL